MAWLWKRHGVGATTLGGMTGNLFDGSAGGKTGAGEWLTAHCDGGSRGNPGPAGFGAVIEDGRGQVVARLSEFLGIQTNNYAEYAGLLAVLKWAVEHGHRRVRVVSDSELMVKQMKGVYKVASPGLRPLWEEAKGLARKLDGFEMSHAARREQGSGQAGQRRHGPGDGEGQGPGNRELGSGAAKFEWCQQRAGKCLRKTAAGAAASPECA